MQKKITFVKLRDNMNIERKVDNLTHMIKELVEHIDIDTYFLSFELTLLVINFIENDFCKQKYKNMDKINVAISIIEKIFEKKLNSEYNKNENENNKNENENNNINETNIIKTDYEMLKEHQNAVNGHLNDRQKKKILADIDHIYKKKMYVKFSIWYIYIIFFFFN